MNGPEPQFIVVGDVHGEAKRLTMFFSRFNSFDGVIVMVGDYINRGPRSRAVLDILQEEKSRRADNLVLLRGNHDVALMTFLDGGPIADFARHGGLATMSSYLDSHPVLEDAVAEFRQHFPSDHLSIIRETAIFHATETTLISHAGIDTDFPLDFTSQRLIDGDPGIFQFSGEWPRPTVVMGHYLQASQQPLISANLIAIDTGCGTLAGAPLTAIRLPDRTVFQF